MFGALTGGCGAVLGGCRAEPRGCQAVPGDAGLCLVDVGQCWEDSGLCQQDARQCLGNVGQCLVDVGQFKLCKLCLERCVPFGWCVGAGCCRQIPVPLSPGSTEPSPGAGAEPGGASTEPGGAGARLAWRVGFPAVLVMNLHEPSVSTRRQSMAESTGVNKCLYNEGRGELAAAPAASPGAGGQRLINAECPPCPPGSRSARRACLPIRGMLRGCSIHPLCRGCSRCSMPRAASCPAGSWGLPHDPPVLLPTWEPG